MKTQHSISSTAAMLPELITLFLEHAWDELKDPHDGQFKSYALVCSTWRHIAQRIAFTNIVLDNYGPAIRFLKAAQANPALTRNTKSLDISLDVFQVDPYKMQGRRTRNTSRDILLQIVRRIILACPQLHHLNVPLYTDIDDQSLIAFLDQPVYATLQALTLPIHPCKDNNLLTLPGIFSFICKFSTLSHLTLPGIDQVKVSGPVDLLHLKPSFKLYELSIQKGDSRDTEILGLTTQWLLGAMDLKNLRILDLRSYWTFRSCELNYHPEEPPQICHDFLERRGLNLHSLRLSMYAKSILEAAQPLYVTCPNLRELILLNCSLPEAVRKGLPVTYLEHLEFSEQFDIPDKEAASKMIDWIISLPRIRSVTLRSQTYEGSILKQYLQDKCTQRGIHFQFVEYFKFGESLAPEDRIKVSHFPRMKTITNRGRMMIPSL